MEENHKKQLKAASNLPPAKRQELKTELDSEAWEWLDSIREIEDTELVSRAAKMDVYIDEIPLPPPAYEGDSPRHYETGSFGNRYLHDETRSSLLAKTRERLPAYRKERREVVELYIKVATLAITGVTGLLGAATGLVALIKK